MKTGLIKYVGEGAPRFGSAPPSEYPTKSDLICNQIAACTGAGGFGKFLQAVTGDCSAKHFEGYFGLDGMTFGILDWTWHNFPGVLKAYQERSPSSFAEKLGALNMPMKNGCVDATWTCNANKNADLMCKPSFHSAFSSALKTPEFRKAQMDYALWEYEKRLARFAGLGLTTANDETSHGSGAPQQAPDPYAVEAVRTNPFTELSDVPDIECHGSLERAGKRREVGPLQVRRERRALSPVGYRHVARVISVPEGVKSDPVGSPVARGFRERHGLDLHVGLIEHPAPLLQNLPHHMTDHLLEAVGQHFPPKFLKQRFFDTFYGRLSELRRGFEARHLLPLGEERPHVLANDGRVEG